MSSRFVLLGVALATAGFAAFDVWGQAAPPPPLPTALPQTPATPGGGLPDLLSIPAPKPQGPKIHFATNTYDFGRIKSGDVVKFTYIFTNVGDQTLELTAVQPTCGCTAAGEWSRKVESGATGTIPIQFNSQSFNGPMTKTVTVTSTDKAQPVVVLQLKGTVWRPVDVMPQFAMINIPADGNTGTTEVKIINNMEEAVTVSPPEVNNALFKADLVTNQPGKEYTVKITVTQTNPGTAQALVTVKTSSTNMPVVNVTAWANVVPAVMVMPPIISLPGAPLVGKATPTITIQNNSTNVLTLSDAAINVPGVDVQLREIQAGRAYNLSLSFPEGFELPRTNAVALTVKSSHPRHPVISVPVSQPLRPPTLAPANATPIPPRPASLQPVSAPAPPAPPPAPVPPAAGQSHP